MLQKLVRRGVEVLQNDRVEARKVLAEELVDGERDEGEIFFGGVHVVGVACAE